MDGIIAINLSIELDYSPISDKIIMLTLGFERNDKSVVVYKTLLNVFGWTERYLQVADVLHGVRPRTRARNYS